MLGIGVFHGLEKSQTFFLVFHERVTLTVRAEIDARAQILHRFEMLDPKIVYSLQKKAAYHRIKRITHFFFLCINLFQKLRLRFPKLTIISRASIAMQCYSR